MKGTGDYAPDFELYGVLGGDRDSYRLSHVTDRGELALLLFYPMDFSPVCTAELCSIRDGAWYEQVEELNVWGISADSLYSHGAFSEMYDLDYPLLTDNAAEVAGRYGVKYDWWDAHIDVPKRAIFLVDRDHTIAYAWSHDDAYHTPDMDPLEAAVEELVGRLDAEDLTVPEADATPEPGRLD